MGHNPSHFISNLPYPVERVSWNDAQEFCEKLNNSLSSQLPGYKFCLPTEAQWEYACRAGYTWAFNGNSSLRMLAVSRLDRRQEPNSVGQKLPNTWGFFDMHGNVWEWCNDWYGAFLNGAAVDPKGPNLGSERVNRGGSWSTDAENCRSACRNHDHPGSSFANLGFRVAAVSLK